MIINNTFNGKMNLDVQEYRIANGDYIDALNITRDSPGSGQDIVVTNVIGNYQVTFPLPNGENKVIGKFPDRIRNRVYIAVWNSNDFDLWLYYDRDSDTIFKIIENLTDTGSEDVLGFDPSYRINHIDIIYNDIQGDLIFYTDGHLTPRKFNVSHILNGNYTVIKTPFIEVAKAPFLDPPTAAYGSDSTRNSNSLRKTLFEFCSRPVYDDFEKGVLFSFSKVPLPVGFYGSDNDIDNTKNNFITITVPTGDENVIAIEIGMRQSLGNIWSDVVLVAHLDKTQLGIPNNSTYQFLFYNDTIYPTVSDGVQYIPDANGNSVQVIPLFFWVPQYAFNQALANGNVPVYGAIKEGYNNYPQNKLDVTLTAQNVTNTPPDTDPPAMTYTIVTNFGVVVTFVITGTVPTGTVYTTYAVIAGSSSAIILSQYTSLFGDTIADVGVGLSNSTSGLYILGPTPTGYQVRLPFGSFINGVTVVSPGGSGISTEKTWMNDCPYIYGLVYFDAQGRDMPGVTTFVNPVNSDNDFLVTTPSFSDDTGVRQTPVISASINHLPPPGAVKYCWVRRRLQYSNWMEYETCDFKDDPDGDGYYYFCLANISAYKLANTSFIYSTAPISDPPSNQRIKILAQINTGLYVDNSWGQDYQILGLVTKTLTGGSSPDNDVLFIKVQKPTTPPSTPYVANMLVMVYTPMVNPTNLSDAVYWEWGESYDTYTLSNVLYHRGMNQEQTASQPATFTWPEGDVYYHQRTMYNELISTPYSSDTVSIMDENFSDFFSSAVNDNGRAQAIEVNATQVYDPVLYRNGGEYQNSTTVNNNPDFYFEDFGQADRSFGDIRKFFIRDRYLYVLQKFKIGIIPVLLQIIRDTAGNPLEANSNELLNKINYPYSEDVGIGDIPESFASDKYAMYGVDDYKKVVWRLSQDGIILLSVLYECNSFFVSNLGSYRKSLNNGYPPLGGVYTGDPSVNCVFDASTNKFIVAMEEINRYNSVGSLIFHQDPYTLTFNEVSSSNGGTDQSPQSEGFETFNSFHPENMVCLDTLFISFKNGGTWKHIDGVARCNYYGVQYGASITVVFNTNSLEKKSWMSLTELADELWECPIIYTNVTSYQKQRQESKLLLPNFKRLENDWHASFKRDINSIGGWNNGGFLKGNYMVVKFVAQHSDQLVYINGVSVFYKDSPLTTK